MMSGASGTPVGPGIYLPMHQQVPGDRNQPGGSWLGISPQANLPDAQSSIRSCQVRATRHLGYTNMPVLFEF